MARKKVPGKEVPKIVPMTRGEFDQFVRSLDPASENYPGEDRAKWQNLAKKDGKSIPAAWLTSHLTRMATRQRQQRRTEEFQARGLAAASRNAPTAAYV